MSRYWETPLSPALVGRGVRVGFPVDRVVTMWYRGSITIPKDTQRANYASAQVDVCQGKITKFYRLFAPGCAGQVALQVFYQTRQIFPTTPGQFYLGDDSEILGDASVELDEPDYVLELRGWSPGTTYQHVVYCEFYIARPTLYLPTVSDRSFVSIPDLLR